MKHQTKQHIEGLRACLNTGTLHVYGDGSLSEAEFQDYGHDRTLLPGFIYSILIFPKTTEEVAAILIYSSKHKLSVVPSGGRTGLCGGAVAGEGEIVVSLTKMDRLLSFDPYLPALSIQAGMVTAQVQRHAQERSLFFPLDLAASGSSQIGGNLATNAGGTRVIRYGGLRNWVLGLTVVSGSGEILRFPGRVIKNNTGFDLKQLFIGQEGILGIITEVTVRLTPIPQDVQISLLACDDVKHCLKLLLALQQTGLRPLAFEFWDEPAMASVCQYLELRNPFPMSYQAYCLLEWDKESECHDPLGSLQTMQQQGLIQSALLASHARQRDEFWRYREGISESLSVHKQLHKQDVSLPIVRIPRFITWLELMLAKEFPALNYVCFGHIGDGNLHINFFPKQQQQIVDEEFSKDNRILLDERVYRMIVGLSGSISAEHGIALSKRDFLSYNRSPYELRLMSSLKQIFDPQSILNPGKMVT